MKAAYFEALMRGGICASLALGTGLAGVLSLGGCASYGELEGQLAGVRFGRVRSAWHGSSSAEGLEITSVVLSDYPYSCDELAQILTEEEDTFTADDGRQVGQVIIHLIGESESGVFSVIEGLDDGDGAFVIIQVVEGEGQNTVAWVLADEGAVTVHESRRGLEGSFSVRSSGGAFSGTFTSEACDLPLP